MTTSASVNSRIVGAVATAFRAAGYGVQARVADALGWPRQLLSDVVLGKRVSPFEQSARIIRTLRAAKVEEADAPFQVLADDLDYVVHRRDHALPSDGASLAATMREMADVLAAHADATDGENDDADTLCLLTELRQLEATVCAFADRLKSRLEMSSPRRIAAWTVRSGKEAK
jgi:hypothetical protein